MTNQLDSIEHETEIHDPIELAAIIGHLGFIPYSDLTKTRQKVKLDDIELCVDTIEELGDFIEAEKLTQDDVDYDVVVPKSYGNCWVILGFKKCSALLMVTMCS